jgi:hypothetical protein
MPGTTAHLMASVVSLAVLLSGCQAPVEEPQPITLASRAHLNYCTAVMQQLERWDEAIKRLEAGGGEADWEMALDAAQTIGTFRVEALAQADEIEAFEGGWLYQLGAVGTVLAHYGDLAVATEADAENVDTLFRTFQSHIPTARRTCTQVTP